MAGNHAILYYPTIKLPDDEWLRKAVLYWDIVSSIVPEKLNDHEDFNSNDITLLKERKIFRPVHPGDIIFHEDFNRFESDFQETLCSKEFRAYLGPRSNWVLDARVHREKVLMSIPGLLEPRGLLRKEPESEWYLFERKTALLFMALLAKHIADQYIQDLMTPSTNHQAFQAFAYAKKEDEPGYACAEILMDDILPVPEKSVPLSAIIDFKNANRSELLRFRNRVALFEAELSEAGTEREGWQACTAFAEETELGVSDLAESLKESRIETIFGSAKLLLNIKSPTLLATIGAVGTAFLGLPAIPVAVIAAGAVVNGGVQISSYYIGKKNEQRAKMRDSAFTYLYLAKKEMY